MSNPLRSELMRAWAGAAVARGLLLLALFAGSAHGEPVTRRSASPSTFHFVVSADDTSYLVLADVEKGADLPPHGPLRLTGEESLPSVIAEVSEAHLPADLRAWSKRKVVVDERCHATVSGFALVVRLVGRPDYAGINDSEWTADTVFSAGQKVLAARLDRCKGTFARAASAAPIRVARPAVNEEAVAAARADFLASEVIVQARKEQAEGGVTGALEQVYAPHVVTVRHPTTGETWISLHLRLGEAGCGDPQANVWGLYRVTARGVERTRLRLLAPQQTLDALLDVDGDGQFELLIQDDFGFSRELRSGEDKVIRRVTMPIYECLC
ncbi:hypothetical protein ACN28I_33265 [Archangium gephyra]|uniref:hypothetical protein n=1 Tax=Archangium gephyra TaxID=48 RepID=UPI003B775DF8